MPIIVGERIFLNEVCVGIAGNDIRKCCLFDRRSFPELNPWFSKYNRSPSRRAVNCSAMIFPKVGPIAAPGV